MSSRQRADILVVEQGLATTRSQAAALILAGVILDAHDQRISKPGALLDSTILLHLKSQPLPYVSRGGLKLAAALQDFALDIQGAVCLDVGASTGGFTDCLLQHGAQKVYAIDVGYGQMALRLRQDPRVHLQERCNIRYLATEHPEFLPGPCDLIVIDVSFISLRLVIPAILPWLKRTLIALIKPQFEVGKEQVGKGGIVRDEAARLAVVQRIVGFLQELNLENIRVTPSPIRGKDGNQEYLIMGQRAL